MKRITDRILHLDTYYWWSWIGEMVIYSCLQSSVFEEVFYENWESDLLTKIFEIFKYAV